jgi:hypothetical protein
MDPSRNASGWLMASSSAATASFSFTTPTLPSAAEEGKGGRHTGACSQEGLQAWLVAGRDTRLQLLQLVVVVTWAQEVSPSRTAVAAARLARQQSLPCGKMILQGDGCLTTAPPHTFKDSGFEGTLEVGRLVALLIVHTIGWQQLRLPVLLRLASKALVLAKP